MAVRQLERDVERLTNQFKMAVNATKKTIWMNHSKKNKVGCKIKNKEKVK